MDVMDLSELAFLALVLIRATYTDWNTGKIENRLIVSGYITALLLAFVENGITGCLESLIGAGGMIIALYFLFVLKGLGAGDIKLLSVIAAFFPDNGISIVVNSFFIAGIFIVCRMVWRKLRKQPVYFKKETLHFSVPIALSTLLEWVLLID